MDDKEHELKDTDKIIVCDKCLTACCWQGIFLCDESDYAGITEMTVKELKEFRGEHSEYWKDSKVDNDTFFKIARS